MKMKDWATMFFFWTICTSDGMSHLLFTSRHHILCSYFIYGSPLVFLDHSSSITWYSYVPIIYHVWFSHCYLFVIIPWSSGYLLFSIYYVISVTDWYFLLEFVILVIYFVLQHQLCFRAGVMLPTGSFSCRQYTEFAWVLWLLSCLHRRAWRLQKRGSKNPKKKVLFLGLGRVVFLSRGSERKKESLEDEKKDDR